MTYSLESLAFRAVGCVVNTAARAANAALEVMYPPIFAGAAASLADGMGSNFPPVEPSVREDKQRGWSQPSPVAPHTKPAATTPAADAAAVEPGGPPDQAPVSALSFADYVVPAITDVLAEHQFHLVLDQCGCGEYMDDYDWREHVAEFLAERIETCLLNRFPK